MHPSRPGESCVRTSCSFPDAPWRSCRSRPSSSSDSPKHPTPTYSPQVLRSLLLAATSDLSGKPLIARRHAGQENCPGSSGFATLIPRALSAPSRSIIQIDADGQKLRPEKSHSSGIARAATNVTAQPALPRERIVIGEQMRRASVPAGMQSIA